MGFHVSDETTQQTTNCQKGFSCLKGNRNDLCAVEHCVDGRIHFIMCKNQEGCSYQLTFGDDFICICPIRKEPYNRYRV